MIRSRRFFSLGILSLCLLLIGIGGIGGGGVFLVDPSGGLMHMPLSALGWLPIHSYLLPGLWLLVVMGLCPLVILYALWARPTWRGAATIERRSHTYWAWTAACTLCAILLLQLSLEWLLGMLAPPTLITGVLGVLAFLCLQMPALRISYALPRTRAFALPQRKTSV